MKTNRYNHLLAAITLAGFAFTASATFAASLTWDTAAGDGSSVTAGGGTWDTSTTIWNDAGTDVAWSQTAINDGSNAAVFAGADGAVDAYEVALGEAIAAESLTFDSSGYKITGNTLAVMVTPTVGPTLGTNGTITIAANKTATINSILRYEHNRAAAITVNSGSVLNLGGGTSGSNRPQWNISGAGTVNLTAGAFGQSIGALNNASINLTGGSHTMTDQNTNVTTNIGASIGSNAGRDVVYTVSGAGTLNAVASSNTSVAYTLHVGRNMGNFKSSLILQSGGSVNVGVTASRAGQINLGSVDGNSNSLLDVQGGTFTVGTGKTSNKLYFFAAGANAGKTATMTQSGGTSTINGIQFGANTGDDVGGLKGANAYDGTALATLRLSGGNLYVGAQGITRGSAAAALPVTIQLQGGTLGASQNWSSVLDMKLGDTAGGPIVRAQDSGSNARNITLAGVLSNDDAVDGSLTKTGSGTLTLTNANTYTGATDVNAGTLLVNAPGSLAPTSAVTVAAGAALGGNGTVNGTVNVEAGGQLIPGGAGTIGTLTLANNSASSLALNGNTLLFDLPNTGTTCDLIDLTGGSGTLTLNDTNTILLNAPNGSVPEGTYTLMTYASKTGPGTLALQNGTTSFANAELTVGDTAVTLTVGPGGLTGLGLVWKGDVSGVWDGGTLNWVRDGMPSQAYADGDVVVFDDSGSDAAEISSGAPVSPLSVYFNNTNKNYTVSAVMAGTTTLTMTGFGTTTLTGANTYTGATTISSGTLKLSGSGRLSTTGTSNVYSSAISLGAGATFEHAGGTQTLSGAITGSGGSVVLAGAASGLILSGSGSSYGSLTLASSVIDGRVFIGNTGALPAAATVAINGGTLVINATGTYNSPITVASGVGISARNAATLTNVILPGSGSVIFNNDDASTNLLTISNGQTLTGPLTIQVGGGKMLTSTTVLGSATLSGKLTGTGSLVVTSAGHPDNTTLFGTGVLTLTGPNDYTGDTTVNSGVLAVTGTSIPDTGKLLINGTGKVNLTNTETVAALDFDGTPQPSGDYSASSVPAGATITTASFTGSGTLTVSPSATNYASWAASQSPAITGGPNGDDDNDGVKNLVEYALADGEEHGTFTGTALSFTKRGAPYGGDLTYSIETSSDLGVSDPWSTVTPDVNDATIISYTLQNPGDNFARLKVVQVP